MKETKQQANNIMKYIQKLQLHIIIILLLIITKHFLELKI